TLEYERCPRLDVERHRASRTHPESHLQQCPDCPKWPKRSEALADGASERAPSPSLRAGRSASKRSLSSCRRQLVPASVILNSQRLLGAFRSEEISNSRRLLYSPWSYV